MKDNILQKHKFIIFCEDHYNPLTLLRSLSRDNLNPIVILIGRNPYLIPASKYANNIVYLSSLEEGLDYIINTFGKEKYKPFIFTCSDNIQSILDSNYSKLIDKFFFFNGGENDQINKYMDKETILFAAQEAGIDIPLSEKLRLGDMPQKISYPIITKSINSTVGGWKKDVFICKNPAELQNAYLHIKSDPVLLEEYIEKENELCIDGISVNGGEEIYMPFKVNYIRFTEKAYGNFMRVSIFEDDTLKEKIRTVLKKTKFSGIFSIEFLITKNGGGLKFLEINFRHSTWAISSRYGGADLPKLWALSQIMGYIDLSNVRLRAESFTAMAEFADFNDHVRYGDLSLWKWLKDFHKCPCTYIYDPNDRKPFFSIFFQRGVKYFKRKISKK